MYVLAPLLTWLLCPSIAMAVAKSALPAQASVIGEGYNLLLGNTDGVRWQSGGQDPGIRVALKVFQVETDNEFAAEVSYVKHDTCQSSHGIDVVYSPKSYQDKLLQRIKFDGQQFPSLQAAAFSLSSGYQDVKLETDKHHHVIYDKETSCVTGSARYRLALALADGYKLTNEVIAEICALPNTNEKQAYTRFIDKWGTHVITEVDLGYRETARSTLNISDFVSYVMKKAPSDVTKAGPVFGASSSYEVDLKSFKTRLRFSDSIGQFYDTLKTGSITSPEPVGLALSSIDVVLSPQFWKGNEDYYTLCPDNITSTLAIKRQFLQQVLQTYPSTKSGEIPIATKLAIPISWPSGMYGLPKATTGCPLERSLWQEGWLKQNPETQTPDSSWTLNHLAGQLTKTQFYLWFCVKNVHSDGLSMEWPQGDYCIFKYNQCPTGFVEGFVRWDDENTHNANSHGGTLPSGEYGADTLMRYCCRSDGSVYTPIVLPTDNPFYLFKYKHGCQEVKGMTSSVEHLVWDNDDSKSPDNAAIGSVHPGLKFCNPPKYPGCTATTVFYCYYKSTVDNPLSIIGK